MKLYRIAIVALFGVFASLQTVNAQSIDEKLETAFQIVTSSTKIDKQTAQGIMNILVPLQDQLDDAPDAQKTKYTFCRMVAAHYAGDGTPENFSWGYQDADTLSCSADSVMWYKAMSIAQHYNLALFSRFVESGAVKLVNPGRVAQLAYNDAVIYEYGLGDENNVPDKKQAMAMYKLAASKTGRYAQLAKNALNDFKLGKAKFKKPVSQNAISGVMNKHMVGQTVNGEGNTVVVDMIFDCPLADKSDMQNLRDKIKFSPYLLTLTYVPTPSAYVRENYWWEKEGLTVVMEQLSPRGFCCHAKLEGNKIFAYVPTQNLSSLCNSRGRMFLPKYPGQRETGALGKWVVVATVKDDDRATLSITDPALKRAFGTSCNLRFWKYEGKDRPDYKCAKTDMSTALHKKRLTDMSSLLKYSVE
jgi:hypothetical protein